MSQFLQSKYIPLAIFALLLILAGAYVLNTPDRRNAGEKISDAINELPNGVDRAAQQLEDRTPGEKLNDAASDAGNDFKKSINQ